MSSISPDFIHSVGYLYEEMNIQDQDFLNENSDHYDAEMSYLVEDILATISTSMIYEGYSASAVIGFLADSSTQDILEKYLIFDENILSESTISEEYIQEQLEIFDYCIDEGLGSVIGKVAKGAIGLAARIATKPARSAVAKKIMTSKNPQRTTAAVERLATSRLSKLAKDTNMPDSISGTFKDAIKKGNISQQTRFAVSAPVIGKVGKAVLKAKDIATKAKPILKTAGKGLGILGLGAAGGYMGAKLAGAGSGSEKITGSSKQTPSSTKDDFLKGSALAKLGGKEGRIKDGEFRTMSWSPESKKRYAAATKGAAKPTPSSATPTSTSSGSSSKPSSTPAVKPKSQDVAKPGETKMQQWARLNPKLAAKVEPGQSGYEEISQTRVKPSSYEKKDQTPTQGPSGATIDTKSVENAKKEFEDRMKKNKVTTSPSTTKESYEPYDVILEYLIGRGHVDTIEEAHYVMLEMDESAVCRIIEEYNDYVLAEEVSEWVNDLLEEGYDLSEYTWDDIVEYYVTESNR